MFNLRFVGYAIVAVLATASCTNKSGRKYQVGLYKINLDEDSRMATFDSDFEGLAESNCEDYAKLANERYPETKILCRLID